MPFLRVIRDKRGYETTYLMHWYREGSRQRSRILYVFRTPGGVRVGRDALEPEVQRGIEAQYPDIAFDWKAVLENRQLVEPPPDLRRPRKKKKAEDGAPTPAAAPAAPPARPEAAPQPPPRPPIPSAIEGATPDEQIAFLTHWYPVLRERIPQRTADPSRQEALLALAERLNPATWTDADRMTAGLQEAAEALDRLSHVFAKRRRRSRKRSAASPGGAPPPQVQADTGEDADSSASDSEPPDPTPSDPSSSDL